MINEYDIEDMCLGKDVIIFESKYSKPHLSTRMEMSAHVHISEVVEQFERFLRAMGYYPPEGTHLDFVEDCPVVNDWEEANV
jgi:hypothetical protein